MLRDVGYSTEDLEPLAELINRTTVYETEQLEEVFQNQVKDE
jgi:hypothetical protein